jgi:hypothetical protein
METLIQIAQHFGLSSVDLLLNKRVDLQMSCTHSIFSRNSCSRLRPLPKSWPKPTASRGDRWCTATGP